MTNQTLKNEIETVFTETNARKNSRSNWTISSDMTALFEEIALHNDEFKVWEKGGQRRIYINDSSKFRSRNVTVAVVDLNENTINLREGSYVSWLSELLLAALPEETTEETTEATAEEIMATATGAYYVSGDNGTFLALSLNGGYVVANTVDDTVEDDEGIFSGYDAESIIRAYHEAYKGDDDFAIVLGWESEHELEEYVGVERAASSEADMDEVQKFLSHTSEQNLAAVVANTTLTVTRAENALYALERKGIVHVSERAGETKFGMRVGYWAGFNKPAQPDTDTYHAL